MRALGDVLDVSRDRVLVIDDGSPDGQARSPTGSPRSFRGSTSSTAGARRGSGGAYLAGFARVLETTDAELVLEMDCDFSHHPADVARLIAACEDGADLVLGSRWVDGGGTANWGLLRRVISRGGSLYARLVLGVSVRDLTGGFSASAASSSRRSTETRSRRVGMGSRSRGRSGPSARGSAWSRCRSPSSIAGSGSRR